jgi:mono/diheme cytochrome c family protein
MSTLAHKACPPTRFASRGLCLLSTLVVAWALLAPNLGQSATPGTAGLESRGSPTSSADQPPVDRTRSRPHQLYRAHCLRCHDEDGRGEPTRDIMRTIPDFTKPEWHNARTNDRLFHSIREGKGSMPAMKRKLHETEVVELVSLIRNFRDGRQVVPEEPEHEQDSSKPTEPKKTTSLPSSGARSLQAAPQPMSAPVNPQAEAGRGLFRRFCAACHGSDGHGSAMRDQVPSIPDFTAVAWQQRRSDPQITTIILEGKGTAMPTFRGKLDQAQLRNLLAHLRTFAPIPMSATKKPPTDFEQRFQQLTKEMDDLKRQYRDLAPK